MKHSRGFSLVELMVAMVIGLVIILGAGQLFLTVFQTQRQVEALGEKQAAVNFAVDSLLRDIRRACWNKAAASETMNGDSLTLTLPDGGDCESGSVRDVTYRLGDMAGEAGHGYALTIDKNDGAGAQEVVSGLTNNGFRVASAGDYGVTVMLELVPAGQDGAPDTLRFLAVNRTEAVRHASGSD
ncbi:MULTISPECIES: PilW family protein [Halomonas]|nr:MULTISPECIES: prepilin-type N-terminal cleavage/methylation domain-containing protein [Halomonas]MDR5890490.1 prepilin-type N-terminal cleavage/methylation domain-containing protein [Halomonas salina]WJY06985.1 prepilin-type N-terminal cleavage/methylation domain-containing protein [Halomonas halophila]